MTEQATRDGLLRRGFRLEVFTVTYNLLEAAVALAAALLAGSTALLAFGLDSVVESTSGGVLMWRLGEERRGADEPRVARVEQRAERLVGATLVLLAGYVAFEGTSTLLAREAPGVSYVGIALTTLSILVMGWLWRAKDRVARGLGSRAMARDAFQTSACFWLSVLALAGLGANALLGWWWADPGAALAMTVPILLEAREAWAGEGAEASGA